MTLGNRLKKAREALGYTQKVMAEALRTNPQTWQVYESGTSVPGGKVLESIARLGFNLNWLLTGEGEMWEEARKALARDKSGADLVRVAKRINEIRGETPLEQFADILEVDKEDVFNMEAGESEPCFNFLCSLCAKFQVNPEWLLVGQGAMKKGSVSTAISIEESKMADVIQVVSEAGTQENVILSPLQVSRLVVLLYRDYTGDSEGDIDSIRKKLSLILGFNFWK